MDKISVIVPVYQMEKYLDKCIASICNQTYDDLEILLVNDGSRDDSPAICEAWAGKDQRVRVIHQENAGQSAARNHGLNLCTGNYVTFVDSDDYIEETMIEKLYKDIKEFQVDISCCDYKDVDEVGNEVIRNTVKYEVLDSARIYSGDEYIRLLLENKHISVVWGKLYSREFIWNHRFRIEYLSEDFCFFCDTIEKKTRMKFSHNKGYNYLVREGSVTVGFNEKFSVDRVKTIFCIEERLRNEFQGLDSYISGYQLRAIGNFLVQMPIEYIRTNQESYQYVMERLEETKGKLWNSQLENSVKYFICIFLISKKTALFIAKRLLSVMQNKKN